MILVGYQLKVIFVLEVTGQAASPLSMNFDILTLKIFLVSTQTLKTQADCLLREAFPLYSPPMN